MCREFSGHSQLATSHTGHAHFSSLDCDQYSGHCDLRPPIQRSKYGYELKVALKWSEIYIENVKSDVTGVRS